ncbi:MAG TPA: hypothetical protein VLY03_00365 [Bacteroidota bacterium]|nr:hypothetical protein [Bacteroidota bacterium]
MISKFPENWELLNFFESEPRLTDPNSPWLYNKLEFVIIRGQEELHALISPSYGQFHFTYYCAKRLIVDLEFHEVDQCTIVSEHDKHYMILRFQEGLNLKDALIFLKPAITLIAGNSDSSITRK